MNILRWILTPILAGACIYFLVSAEIGSLRMPMERAAAFAARSALAPPQPPASVLFTGDVMLDRAVALHAAAHGDDSLIASSSELFRTVDAVIINLEGTITPNPSIAIANHADLRFTFDPRFGAWLAAWNVKAASLSNNHADDFGAAGLAETRGYLAANGVAAFGAPDNGEALSSIIRVGGSVVCLVGYEGFVNANPAPVAAEIARLRPGCDRVFATMHAGEEYQSTTTTALQRTAAHAFIDAGADAVLGSHPHVVEPLELYKGKPIFYSLGNFIFDQDFSWATEHGLAIRAALSATSTTYDLVPMTIQHAEASTTPEGPDYDRTIGAATLYTDPVFANAIRSRHSFTIPR